jgi:hypothetical protein
MPSGSYDRNGGSPGVGSLLSKIFFRTLDEDLVKQNRVGSYNRDWADNSKWKAIVCVGWIANR